MVEIVAEISCNHLGSLDRALKLIEAAKESGADAVKFQAYTADSLTIDCDKPDFIIKNGPWKGRKLYDLYKKAETPREWFPTLIAHAEKIGISWFASVFSKDDVDFMESLGCPRYKIASFEIVDTPMIRYTGLKNKPLILSTGMATWDEIEAAVQATTMLWSFTLLHCVSSYPTQIAEARLMDFVQLRELYGDRIGLSDHSFGYDVAVAATALGARMIEKHLTLSRADGGPDAAFSMEMAEFKEMSIAVKAIAKAMEPIETRIEESSKQLRRSLYAVKDIAKGDLFTEGSVRSIRPSYGLSPALLPDILGKTADRDYAFGDPV